jgi:Phage tail protein
MLAPPLPAEPGQPYGPDFLFTTFAGGTPVDPTTLEAVITYGGGPVVAGPWTYAGASSEASGSVWRTGTGAYSLRWDVPLSGLLPGAYEVTWTSTYGPDEDVFEVIENFAITGGGPFVPVPAGDVGYWTGSISYQPSWATSPFVINFGEVDDNGVSWILKKVTGWDGPPTVGQVIQRSADHGGWPSAQFYGPRLLTLDVMASAPNQALRDQAKTQLVQAIPVSDLAVFTYNEPVPKQAAVRQSAGAKIAMDFPTLSDVTFKIPLTAPDPRKYSTIPLIATATQPAPVINPLTLPVTLPIGFPGSTPAIDNAITCVNSGTFETRPMITLSGPIISPAIVNAVTGQSISYTGLSMGASDQLLISTDLRQSYLNGSFFSADVTSGWWVLDPGTTQVYLTGSDFAGGATLTVAWSSAWA